MANNNSTFQTNDGIIRFYDGTIIAIETREYSADGKYNWEKIFNPFSHISTLDNITELSGHEYTRVKHTGDTVFQLPYRMIPKEPIFRVNLGLLEWKFIEEDDSEFKLLLDTETLRGVDGIKGDQGIKGDGINIDEVGYYLTRRDCCSTITANTCSTCNPSDDTNIIPYLFLSLGDGAKEIVIGDVGKYKRCNSTDPWIQISSTDIGTLCRYIATDAIGTGEIDYRLQDTLTTRGKVYICADGIWTEFISLNVPVYMVGESTGSSNIGYLDHFILALQNALIGTITIQNGKLEIVEESINETAFNEDTFGDGIDIPTAQDKPEIQVEDFIGFGLRNYTSDIDLKENIQVFIDDFISDGLISEDDSFNQVDGEDRNLIRINVDDFISPTTSVFTGLQTSTDASIVETDGFDNIYIKPGDAITIDGDGVNVTADELSLTSDNLDFIKVYETDSNTLGIQAKHIHKNAVDELKGLQKANDTTGSIEIKPDSLRGSIGFNGNGDIHIPDNAILGVHLNDDTTDNNKGVEIINDMITVKVDGTSINFNGSGELFFTGDLAAVISATTDVVIKSITPSDNGAIGDTVRDNVIFRLNDGLGTIANITGDSATDILTSSINIDIVWLENFINSLLVGGIPTYWGELEKSNTESITIEDFIDGLNHVELDKWYNNIQISSGNTIFAGGLLIKSGDGSITKRLIMDNNGNLDTVNA